MAWAKPSKRASSLLTVAQCPPTDKGRCNRCCTHVEAKERSFLSPPQHTILSFRPSSRYFPLSGRSDMDHSGCRGSSGWISWDLQHMHSIIIYLFIDTNESILLPCPGDWDDYHTIGQRYPNGNEMNHSLYDLESVANSIPPFVFEVFGQLAIGPSTHAHSSSG